jgi:hypothetical protein
MKNAKSNFNEANFFFLMKEKKNLHLMKGGRSLLQNHHGE